MDDVAERLEQMGIEKGIEIGKEKGQNMLAHTIQALKTEKQKKNC